MSITYNGFAPGETRSRTRKPNKADKGHSIVEQRQTRKGHDFLFIYTSVCECGKIFRGRTSSTPFYSHLRHLKREGVL